VREDEAISNAPLMPMRLDNLALLQGLLEY